MQNSVSPQIIELRARYQSSLPEKAAMIEEHIVMLSSGGDSDDKISETHEVLHKLAGSAGMYGYDEISSLCRQAMTNSSQQNLSLLLPQLTELKNLLDLQANGEIDC